MKFCMPHWEELRAAIKARGLDSLVSKGGEQAIAKLTSELDKGEATKDTFDPLMGAHNAILTRALDMVGLELMSPNEDGSERCPLCFLISKCECTLGEGCHFKHWIPSVADFMLEEAKRYGLVGAA